MTLRKIFAKFHFLPKMVWNGKKLVKSLGSRFILTDHSRTICSCFYCCSIWDEHSCMLVYVWSKSAVYVFPNVHYWSQAKRRAGNRNIWRSIHVDIILHSRHNWFRNYYAHTTRMDLFIVQVLLLLYYFALGDNKVMATTFTSLCLQNWSVWQKVIEFTKLMWKMKWRGTKKKVDNSRAQITD